MQSASPSTVSDTDRMRLFPFSPKLYDEDMLYYGKRIICTRLAYDTLAGKMKKCGLDVYDVWALFSQACRIAETASKLGLVIVNFCSNSLTFMDQQETTLRLGSMEDCIESGTFLVTRLHEYKKCCGLAAEYHHPPELIDETLFGTKLSDNAGSKIMVYYLGLLLYEMLTGCLPFPLPQASEGQQTPTDHQKMEHISGHYAESFTQQEKSLIKACLKYDPQFRPGLDVITHMDYIKSSPALYSDALYFNRY